MRACTLCNYILLLSRNVAHLPPASSSSSSSSPGRCFCLPKRALFLQRQATHSVSILASLSSFRVIRKTKKEALTGSVCTVHDENEAAHVSLLLGVRRKENISFRVSNATLNVFSLGKNVARTRGYVLSLSPCFASFSTVSVCSIIRTVCHASYLGDLSVCFSLLFSLPFSLALRNISKERTNATMRRGR
jgi:hypothetical protein